MLAADSGSLVLIVTFDQLAASPACGASGGQGSAAFLAQAPSASDRWRVGVWKEELRLGPFGDIEHPDIELGLHSRVATFWMQRVQDRVVVEPFNLIIDRPRLTELVFGVRLKIDSDQFKIVVSSHFLEDQRLAVRG